MAANIASQSTMQTVGLSFVRAFASGGPYEDPIAEANEGEVEYEITRAHWQRNKGPRAPL